MNVPRVLILSLSIVFIWAIPVYSGDPSEKEIEKLIQDEKSELISLKKKIKKQAREISSMGKRESKILKTLGTLDNKKKVRERELAIYRWNIKINKNQLNALARKIKITEKQLNRQKTMIGKRLRALHKEGEMFPIKVLFSAENYSDLVQKMKYMELLMSHDSRIFESYQKRWEQSKEEEKKTIRGQGEINSIRNCRPPEKK